MIKSRINISNHLLAGWTFVIYLLGSILYPIYMINRFGSEDKLFFVQTAFCLFFVFFIPHLIIHLNYYYLNRNDLFGVDNLQGKIFFEQDGVRKNYGFADIEFVEQYRSLPFAENRTRWFPWDKYNYSIISLKGGKKIIVTSLLVPKLELELDEDKKVLKKRFYCWASRIKS